MVEIFAAMPTIFFSWNVSTTLSTNIRFLPHVLGYSHALFSCLYNLGGACISHIFCGNFSNKHTFTSTGDIVLLYILASPLALNVSHVCHRWIKLLSTLLCQCPRRIREFPGCDIIWNSFSRRPVVLSRSLLETSSLDHVHSSVAVPVYSSDSNRWGHPIRTSYVQCRNASVSSSAITWAGSCLLSIPTKSCPWINTTAQTATVLISLVGLCLPLLSILQCRNWYPSSIVSGQCRNR